MNESGWRVVAVPEMATERRGLWQVMDGNTVICWTLRREEAELIAGLEADLAAARKRIEELERSHKQLRVEIAASWQVWSDYGLGCAFCGYHGESLSAGPESFEHTEKCPVPDALRGGGQHDGAV